MLIPPAPKARHMRNHLGAQQRGRETPGAQKTKRRNSNLRSAFPFYSDRDCRGSDPYSDNAELRHRHISSLEPLKRKLHVFFPEASARYAVLADPRDRAKD